MAKIIFSGMFPDLHGKFGDSIIVRGRYGTYVREYVKPRNPRTSKQMKVRAGMAMIARLWRTLTSEEVRAWNMAARTRGIKCKDK